MTELPLLPATLAVPQHPAAAAAKAEELGGVPRAVAVAVAVAVAEDVAATTRRRQHLLLLPPHPALRCPSLAPWPPTTCASTEARASRGRIPSFRGTSCVSNVIL